MDLKKFANRVITIDTLKPKKHDPIAYLKAFNLKSKNVDYDLNSIGNYEISHSMPLKKIYSKSNLEIDSYINLPIQVIYIYLAVN